MIIQIRATSGGGKTTLMRRMLEHIAAKPVMATRTVRGKPAQVVIGYKGHWSPDMPAYVVGSYESDQTGGCDRIREISEVIELVDKFAKPTHHKNGAHTGIVLLEGLLIAHSWGALGEHCHAQYGPRYLNAFIDTPVDVCVARVLQRRAARGADNTDEDRVAKITKNIVADHYRVELAHSRVLARGGRLVDLPHKYPQMKLAKVINAWTYTRTL